MLLPFAVPAARCVPREVLGGGSSLKGENDGSPSYLKMLWPLSPLRFSPGTPEAAALLLRDAVQLRAAQEGPVAGGDG